MESQYRTAKDDFNEYMFSGRAADEKALIGRIYEKHNNPKNSPRVVIVRRNDCWIDEELITLIYHDLTQNKKTPIDYTELSDMFPILRTQLTSNEAQVLAHLEMQDRGLAEAVETQAKTSSQR